MSTKQFRQITGLLFVIGAILINIPYTLLIMNFDYPDILRAPTAEILTKFHAGGSPLIYTWLAFAWIGIPILFGIIMLNQVLVKEKSPFLETATTVGVVGGFVQIIGLLRWVFVIPVLARLFTDPTTDSATKTAIPVVFIAVHQYGGVILGEHMGQFLTIIWMSMISAIIYKSPIFDKWVAWLGWIASAVFILAQTELFATAIPNFPVIDWAGLYGSLLWLLWIIVIGVYLLKSNVEADNR